MTVVTHSSNETCNQAKTDLKANIGFAEKRHHTCTKSMMDENEIIALIEKINVMVSENNSQCYRRQKNTDENKGQKQHLGHSSYKDERLDSSVFQQNQRGEIMLAFIDYTKTCP